MLFNEYYIGGRCYWYYLEIYMKILEIGVGFLGMFNV